MWRQLYVCPVFNSGYKTVSDPKRLQSLSCASRFRARWLHEPPRL